MYTRILYALTAAVILAAVAAGCWLARERIGIERGFNQVEIAVFYDEAAFMAAAEGRPFSEVLAELKEAGVTTVFFKEPSLEEGRVGGLFEVCRGSELVRYPAIGPAVGQVSPGSTCLVIWNRDTFRQMQELMRTRLPGAVFIEDTGGPYLAVLPVPFAQLKDMGTGFPREPLQEVADAGLRTVVQVRSWKGATPESIAALGEYLRDIPGLSAVAFNDLSLPGFPAYIDELAGALEELGVPVADIEFYPQVGLKNLGSRLAQRTVLTHTIAVEEMPKYDVRRAADRYVLAATERNVRLLVVRLFFDPAAGGTGVLAENAAFLSGIATRLEAEGLTLGTASRMPGWNYPLWLNFLVGLGVIAGGVLLLDRLGFRRLGLVLGTAAALGWAAMSYGGAAAGAKLMALGAATVFPTLSVITFVRPQGTSPWQSLLRLAAATGLSLVGAVLLVGALAGTRYMLKLDAFSGVKLAHLLPLLLVALYFAFLLPSGRRLADLKQQVESMLNQPILVKFAVACAILAAFGLVYLLRTGNDAGTLVLPLELKVRAFLDQALAVRPRTKEFLIGHPLLLLLFYTGYRNARYLVLVLLAAIGQISAVMTFAHLHTPLEISLIRVFNGLWLGALIGLVLIAAWCLFDRLAAPARLPAMEPPGWKVVKKAGGK
ncbi:MAG: DUF5693 family protein [Bacillota bacterium]|uniref:DUF5693 family protein n=1 Tax=Desulforudis sp. DRI-14 TaxID=3459793 RepID=UPI003498586E